MKTSDIIKLMKKEYLKNNNYLCIIARQVIFDLPYNSFQSRTDRIECHKNICRYINKSINYQDTVSNYLNHKYLEVSKEDCHEFRLYLLDKMINFFTKKEKDNEF